MSPTRTDTDIQMGQLISDMRALKMVVDEIKVACLGDGNGHLGLRIRVDRIEQREISRQWWIRSYAAMSLGSLFLWIQQKLGLH